MQTQAQELNPSPIPEAGPGEAFPNSDRHGERLSLADFSAGGSESGPGPKGSTVAGGLWESAPLEGGSQLWAFGAGFLSGKIKTRSDKAKFLPYLENYIKTVTPILELIEFDRVAGIGGLENIEMDDSTRFKVGIGALVISSLFVSPDSAGPSLSDLMAAFVGAGGDPVQVVKNLEESREEGTGDDTGGGGDE